MNKEQQTDWLTFYNKLDGSKIILENRQRRQQLSIYAYMTGYDFDTQQNDFSTECDKHVRYAIEDFKENTLYLRKPALLDYIKEEKLKTFDNWTELKAHFARDLFRDVTSTYKHFLNQLEISLNEKTQPQPVGLEEIFSDKNKLFELVELLIGNNYSDKKNEILNWTGQPVEFAAMAEVCTPLLKKGHTSKDIHKAFTTYFHFKIGYGMFKPGNNFKTYNHKQKFDFIRKAFNIE